MQGFQACIHLLGRNGWHFIRTEFWYGIVLICCSSLSRYPRLGWMKQRDGAVIAVDDACRIGLRAWRGRYKETVTYYSPRCLEASTRMSTGTGDGSTVN